MPELETKDFFVRQEEALSNSVRLLPLFLLALIGVIASTYFVYTTFSWVVWGFWHFWADTLQDRFSRPFDFPFWSPVRLMWITVIVLTLFLIASLRKLKELEEGGRAIARILGAKRVNPGSKDPEKRRLLNVVEEMSVASGVPVPDVYVLEREPSINAFVAGHSVEDMVVGATAGATRYLTRDELQGVIAHEYSHIFNGDMALNIRLMGWVQGLFAVTAIADAVMDWRNRVFARELSVTGEKEMTLGPLRIFMDLFITVVGFALSFIGWHGAVFGRLVKAAVSRQREYLADAAAVEFTRYPEGLAEALEKVRKWPEGGQVICPQAEQASHMFFADALQGDRYFLLMSTHPPVEERIRRIRNMMGRYMSGRAGLIEDPFAAQSKVDLSENTAGPAPQTDKPAGAELVTAMAQAASASAEALGTVPAVAQVGVPVAEHLLFAQKLLENLPLLLKDAARDTMAAPAVVYALLLASEQPVRAKQLALLREELPLEVYQMLEQLIPDMDKLAAMGRLPLLELALPALRFMSLEEFRSLQKRIQQLIAADEELDLFEFAVQYVLRRHLEAHLLQREKPDPRYFHVKAVGGDLSVVLSVLAILGQDSHEDVLRAFAAGVRSLKVDANLRFLDGSQCTLATVKAALDNLCETSPSVKRSVLQACAAVVAADGQIMPAEGELLRAVADALDCPVPPLVPVKG